MLENAAALLMVACALSLAVGFVAGLALANRPPDSQEKRMLIRRWTSELDAEVARDVESIRGRR